MRRASDAVAAAPKKTGKWRSAARGSPRVTAALKRFGQRLRVLRHERELTQERLAELASLDGKHVQAIEAGTVNITFASLLALSRALGVKLSDLLDGV